MIEGSSPTLVWTTSKSGDIVSMKSIDLNHPQLS
jgi:hypothetical protein